MDSPLSIAPPSTCYLHLPHPIFTLYPTLLCTRRFDLVTLPDSVSDAALLYPHSPKPLHFQVPPHHTLSICTKIKLLRAVPCRIFPRRSSPIAHRS